MGCVVSLSLNQSSGDNPMDAAVFASGSSVIVGCRGNRLFVCDPTSGVINSSLDVGPWASGKSSLAYDAGTGKIYFAPWNTPQYAITTAHASTYQESRRHLYRLSISGGSLILEQTLDMDTIIGSTIDQYSYLEVGITAMDSGNGKIFCRYNLNSLGAVNLGSVFLGFTSGTTPTAANIISLGTGATWNNLQYQRIAGDDWIFTPDAQGQQVAFYDVTVAQESVFPISLASSQTILAVGADTGNHVYVTDAILGVIYVFHPNGDRTTATLLNTINTGHSAFNGLSVRYRASDGFIYVAGGSDNSVAVINPALGGGNGGLVGGAVLTGFDAPTDFVFTSTARFAVQSGSVPLKAF